MKYAERGWKTIRMNVVDNGNSGAPNFDISND